VRATLPIPRSCPSNPGRGGSAEPPRSGPQEVCSSAPRRIVRTKRQSDPGDNPKPAARRLSSSYCTSAVERLARRRGRAIAKSTQTRRHHPANTYCTSSTRRIRDNVRTSELFRSCSHIRMTVQPLRRRMRVTRRSRFRLAATLRVQNGLSFGSGLQPRVQPCQKHPSIKMARRHPGNTKSGLPKRGYPRRQPVKPASRIICRNLSSVVALPRLRTRDMLNERPRRSCTSTTRARSPAS
jgi:hypothetical protein